MSKQVYALLLGYLIFFAGLKLVAQAPPGYYDGTSQLHGEALKAALHNIIKNHQPHTYAQLWQDFFLTDQKANGKVWDMYSDIPGGTPAYEYTFFTDQCGNYNGEGVCYNREHSWPKSWFGDMNPMYTDLFHLYPTDGYVNNKRGNFPYGEVGQASWTSTNGSRVGSSTTEGYSGTVFEPIDAYKGDLARGLMYMSVRYFTEDANWPGSDMTTGAEFKTWAKSLLLKWHQQDPVSVKEVERNNAIYSIQNNRNPFVDFPTFAALVWDTTASLNDIYSLKFKVFPNPAHKNITLSFTSNSTAESFDVEISDVTGKVLFMAKIDAKAPTHSLSVEQLPAGFYLLSVSEPQRKRTTVKLLVN